MTTTIVKNSIVGDDWIRQAQMAAPPQKVMKADANGVPQWTGDILTGPVRLSFPNLFTLPAQRPGNNSAPKFGASLLLPPPLPGQDLATQMALFYEEYYRIAAASFASFWNPDMGQYVGIESPFHDQGMKFKYDGYTSGCMYFNATSKFKPNVVRPIPGDPNNFNPVVDEKEGHPGVWAICAINCYAYGVNPPQPKKGPGFGLQAVILIGDDTNIGAAKGADAKTNFGQIAAALPAGPIQRPNLSGLPLGQSMPGGVPPGVGAPPPVMPGIPSRMPGVPQTISTTYRPAPPPPTPVEDEWDFMK